MRGTASFSVLGWMIAAMGVVLALFLLVAAVVRDTNAVASADLAARATTNTEPDTVNVVTTGSVAPVATSVPLVIPSDSLAVAVALEQHQNTLYDNSVKSVVQVIQLDGSLGSGWVYATDSQSSGVAYIVSNFHVVQSTQYNDYLCDSQGQTADLAIKYYDESFGTGCVVGFDMSGDLAVVRVEKAGLTPLPLGRVADVNPGDFAFALGNPFGNNFTITRGIVSQVGRLLDSGFSGSYSVGAVVQTDAALNQGNSGGPLLDLSGRVIGVNTQIQTSSGGANAGIGFAVPVDLVDKVARAIISQGYYEYPYLGISAPASPTPNQQTTLSAIGFDNPELTGSLITSVVGGGPADNAGLRQNDLVTGVGICGSTSAGCTASTIRSVVSLADIIGLLNLYTQPNDWVALEVVRPSTISSDSERRIEVQLGIRP